MFSNINSLRKFINHIHTEYDIKKCSPIFPKHCFMCILIFSFNSEKYLVCSVQVIFSEGHHQHVLRRCHNGLYISCNVRKPAGLFSLHFEHYGSTSAEMVWKVWKERFVSRSTNLDIAILGKGHVVMTASSAVQRLQPKVRTLL